MRVVGKSSIFGRMIQRIPPASPMSQGVICPVADVAVPDYGCGHRIKLWLLDGEPLRCKGPKCPRFPKELRETVGA